MSQEDDTTDRDLAGLQAARASFNAAFAAHHDAEVELEDAKAAYTDAPNPSAEQTERVAKAARVEQTTRSRLERERAHFEQQKTTWVSIGDERKAAAERARIQAENSEERFRTISHTTVLLAAGSLFVTVMYYLRSRRQSERRVESAERARIAARNTASPRSLQEKAIDAYTERLRDGIDGLRARAFVSFVPGLLLCVAALSGPLIAYQLATVRGDWHFMLGGSTIAAVLLAAGTALLRHDNKIRDQIQAAQGELLYFSRIKTGLDCAAELKQYEKSLGVVVDHLLGAPPQLAMGVPAGEADGTAQTPLDMIETGLKLLKAPAEAEKK